MLNDGGGSGGRGGAKYGRAGKWSRRLLGDNARAHFQMKPGHGRVWCFGQSCDVVFTIDRSIGTEGAWLTLVDVATVLCGSEAYVCIARGGGRLGCGACNGKCCGRGSVSGEGGGVSCCEGLPWELWLLGQLFLWKPAVLLELPLLTLLQVGTRGGAAQ